ncbi:MAG: flagellar biosynthesis protein FlhF [Deltaproteobacteria bacterium]|nr:flagellar biosynthesis protein FlhF [Deltaproteobacteria bacterium]
MNIKKFIANNAQEAIQVVKKEMGPEAVILRTRTLHSSGEGGKRSVQKIEVTAAVDYEAPVYGYQNQKHLDPDSVLKKWQHMEMELKEIKETLLSADASAILMPEIYFNKELRTRYTNFKTFGLRSDIIRELMNECYEKGQKGVTSASKLLQDSLSRVVSRINVNGNNKTTRGRKIVSFIGPTGVGKTTTLAKLAAINAIKQGKKAALITLDTFRIAAVAQLQTYARIMGIPLEVVVNSTDLQKAIHKHRHCDFILIDTAGRSPNKDQDITELRNFFRISEEIHHYLVLSATTRYQNLLNADKRFGVLPYKSYIFTKLDEIQDASSMVNFLITRQKPVSYFTFGQQVPDDIEVASRKKLAALILSGMKKKTENPINEVNRYGSGFRASGHGRR